MKEKEWGSGLGEDARNIIGDIYEGSQLMNQTSSFSIPHQNSLAVFQGTLEISFTFKKIRQTSSQFTKTFIQNPNCFF